MQEIKKGWKKVKLGDVIKVISGYAFKASDFIDNGIPIIKIKNIKEGYTDIIEDVQYVKNDFKIDEKFIISNGDVLISLTGSHISQWASVVGRVGKYNHKNIALLNQRAGKIFCNNVNREYLYYLLFSYDMRYRIASLSNGAASQANISPGDIHGLEVIIPVTIESQQKIASILSKYDDLIENNNKRIKILEETAQSIYEEWFVKYNFPGSENIKMVDSGNDNFGMIPEGWEVKKVGELLEKITRKQKIKTTEYLEKGSYPIIDQGREFIAGFTNDEKLVEKDLLPMVIFGDHTRILKYVDFPFVCGADGTQLLFPKNQKLLPVYFYIAIKNIDLGNFHYARHFKFLKEEYIIIPGDEILEKLNNNLKDSFKLSEELRKQNQNLKETRDLLIPRLVSGELDVETLDVK